jgi:hypothetical protein
MSGDADPKLQVNITNKDLISVSECRKVTKGLGPNVQEKTSIVPDGWIGQQEQALKTISKQ